MLAITFRKNSILCNKVLVKQIPNDTLTKVGIAVDDEGYVTYSADDQQKYEDSQRKAKLYNALELLFPIGGGILGYKLFGVPGAVVGSFAGLISLVVWEVKVRNVGLM
jgi:hypothetical protein